MKNDRAVVGVVGLGYVGLPLALAFVERGLGVLGFDIDAAKVAAIERGDSYIAYLPAARVAAALGAGLSATTDFSRASECDALLMAVPTPLTRHREPDLSFVERTAEQIAPHLRAGQLVVLESTTYPGTTREVVVPILEEHSGLVAGEDFFVAYSPEREDPHNKEFDCTRIPKIVGGLDEKSLALACALYGRLTAVVPVSSLAAAEAAKLLENIFRGVNIALVNEMKLVLDAMDLDVWEVIDAAATKPFGFMPFYPGPGLGGHCIPIDPFYLTWKAREVGVPTRFIELAGEINTRMPEYVVERLAIALNDRSKSVRGARILIVGMAYKKNVDDLRESASLRLVRLLLSRGADVAYHDPHIPKIKPTREYPDLAGLQSVPLDDLTRYDAVLIATAHDGIDFERIAREAAIVVDTRNAIRRRDLANVYRA
ncbi:nucleotide sugar dehydrogenase [bacterium]|nr:nucleotide sugar dehydrogenase [bacterium]